MRIAFRFDNRGDNVTYHVVYLLSLLAENLTLNQMPLYAVDRVDAA